MTRSGDKTFCPELFYRIVNVYILDPQTGKFLFVLQKDRQKKNLWTPVCGEIDVPIQLEQQANMETLEEVGVKIKIINIFRIIEFYDQESPFWEKEKAHMEIIELLTLLSEGEAKCMSQPDEPNYEIIKLSWFTLREFKTAVLENRINTYPNILDSIDLLISLLHDSNK